MSTQTIERPQVAADPEAEAEAQKAAEAWQSPDPETTPDDNGAEESGETSASSTPETENESPEDEANRFTDKELLGRSFAVRRATYAAAHQPLRAVRRGLAAARNGIAAPKLVGRRWLKDRAEASRDRMEARRDNAKSTIARRHYDRKLTQKQTRFENKDGLYKAHAGAMETRRTAPKQKWESGRDTHNNDLKQKRGESLARKELRKFAKEQEGMGALERRKFVKNIAGTELSQAVGAALQAKADERSLKGANRRVDKVTKQATKAEQRSATSYEALHSTQQQRLEAIRSLGAARERYESLRGPAQQAQENVTQAQQELEAFGDDDTLSPDYIAAQAALDAAQAVHARYTEHMRKADREIKVYEDTIAKLRATQQEEIATRRETTYAAQNVHATQRQTEQSRDSVANNRDDTQARYAAERQKILDGVNERREN